MPAMKLAGEKVAIHRNGFRNMVVNILVRKEGWLSGLAMLM
jgi:hypothetical protein